MVVVVLVVLVVPCSRIVVAAVPEEVVHGAVEELVVAVELVAVGLDSMVDFVSTRLLLLCFASLYNLYSGILFLSR